MPDIDPDDYREHGKKEPILAKGWLWGVLGLAVVAALAYVKIKLIRG